MRMTKSILPLIAIASLTACEAATETSSDAGPTEEASAAPETAVELALVDKLDGVTSEFCIDIAGGNQDIDITKGLQAHTCYSYRGSLGDDQAFDPAMFADGKLYMPVYEVCATASAIEAGASVGLAACDDSEAQGFTFAGEGTISLTAAPELCVTASGESRFGRSDVHQIRDLSIEACSDEAAATQTWIGRTQADVDGAASDTAEATE